MHREIIDERWNGVLRLMNGGVFGHEHTWKCTKAMGYVQLLIMLTDAFWNIFKIKIHNLLFIKFYNFEFNLNN